jgi:hypothetical protein
MNKQIDKRLSEIETRANLNQPPKVRVWHTEIEEKIDRIMEWPDSADFRFGFWGQIFDKDGRLVVDEGYEPKEISVPAIS